MRRKTMKVTRGRLEEERRKEQESFEYQRVLLFMLPVIMIAVLVIGIYFGYLSFEEEHIKISNEEREQAQMTEKYTEEESAFLLTVVSSASPVDSSFAPILEKYSGVELSYLLVDDLKDMLADAKSQGMNIQIDGGYISFEEQKEIYDKAVKAYKKKKKCTIVKAEVAVRKTTPNAGESERQTGLVVEFSNGTDEKFQKTAEYRWLYKNAVNYDFVLRYPEKENTGAVSFSPKLFRYVGKENAFNMRAYNMNLDEYSQYLKSQ